MTIFRKDPMDDILPDTVVKYYLGKITGAGEIGKRVDGNIIPYFTGEDIGVIQSSALLQNFNTSEFKDSSLVENTNWVDIVTSNNTAGTVSKTYGFGDGSLAINWNSISPFNDTNNRTTEVNYCNAILDPVADSKLRDNFGWFQIGQDLKKGLPGLTLNNPDQVFSYISGIRDDPSKSLVTKEEFPSTKFPNSTVNKNLLSAFESIYGSNQAERDEVFDRNISSFFSIDGYVQNASNRLDRFLGDTQSYVDYTGGIGIHDANVFTGVLLNYNYARTGLTFTGLNDTPSSYDDGKFLVSLPDGIGYTGLSGQISSQEINWDVYPTPADLPSATLHHGMFAHVHSEGAGYMAHAGQWEKIYPQSFTGLSGTPSSLTADKYLKVNSAGDGFEFDDGCCNTIKIRKNTVDTPTTEMAREVISSLYFSYKNAGSYPFVYYHADFNKIFDGDSNTYWEPNATHNSFSSQWTKTVTAALQFKQDIYINAIQWSGEPWFGRVQQVENSTGIQYRLTSNEHYGVTPFTTGGQEVSTSALEGQAYTVKQGWGSVLTKPALVPTLDFSNLPLGGNINKITWNNDYDTSNRPFASLVGNGRQGRYPRITDIKLAYSFTDPSIPNYVVERPFAAGGAANTNATIYLQRGQSYIFQIESDGNPFYIKTANSAGTADLFSAGVTNNGVEEGDLIFQVPYDAPQILYYVSSNVSTLSGMIRIPM